MFPRCASPGGPGGGAGSAQERRARTRPGAQRGCVSQLLMESKSLQLGEKEEGL